MGLFGRKRKDDYILLRCSGFNDSAKDDREAVFIEKIDVALKYDKNNDYCIVPCEGFIPILSYKLGNRQSSIIIDDLANRDCMCKEGFLFSKIIEKTWRKGKYPDYDFTLFYCRVGQVRLKMGTQGVPDPSGKSKVFRGHGSYTLKINYPQYFIKELIKFDKTILGKELQTLYQDKVTSIINKAIQEVFAGYESFGEALTMKNDEIADKISDKLNEFWSNKYKDARDDIMVSNVTFLGELADKVD